jgi:peptidoglycan/xylan/chitin deacetylase (PgdA/CDA1 family)
MTPESVRNARLLLGRSAASNGAAGALRTRRIPPYPVRVGQRVAMKAGVLTYERNLLAPLVDARREALGDAAIGPPRFLVRVDEFPHYLAGDEPERYGTEMSRRFHSILASAGVPYLMAIVPRIPVRPLDPSTHGDAPLDQADVDLLEQMGREGVSFGLHGYNHRTRYASPRRHSELCGLSDEELIDLLDRGLRELSDLNVHPRVFVPPFNRFDAHQYDILARQFKVVCGGPESVPLLGFHNGPQWRGDAVYLPCYAPLYAAAKQCRPAARQLVEQQVGTWVPIVLHSGWEADDNWENLERFAEEIAPYAASWEDFLEEVEASK